MLTFFAILYKLLYEGPHDLKLKIKILFISSLIVLFGVGIFFVQQYFSEPDYANRIGVHYLSINDKYDNALEFLRIFFTNGIFDIIINLFYGKIICKNKI